MVFSQTKRSQGLDNTISVGGQTSFTVTASNPCNVHGLILDLHIGSNVGAEHNFGYWALYLLPREQTSIPTVNTTNMTDERDTQVMWMAGSWTVIDRGFIHIGGAPRTSRNCPKDGRLVLVISNSALSTTAVRANGLMTWFETIK